MYQIEALNSNLAFGTASLRCSMLLSSNNKEGKDAISSVDANLDEVM